MSLSDVRPFPDEGPSMRGFGASSEGRHMFQRKVYDGAMRTLTEYRRHLDGRSSDSADENRQRCAWLSLRDCGSRCQKSLWPPYRKCIPFQTWPLSVRVALASQIRWHIRAELTCDVGYAFDPVKISREAFRPTTAVAVGSRLKFGAAEWKR